MSSRRPVVVAGSGEFTVQVFADVPPEHEIDFRFAVLDTPADVARETAGADAVVVDDETLSAEHIAALAPSVRVIGRSGTGLDAVDVEAARARGVAVIYLPDFATGEVADHTIALILGAVRRIARGDEVARDDWAEWRQVGPLVSMREATIGLIGLGRIGGGVLERLQGFGSTVFVFDPAVTEAPAGAYLAATMDEVLAAADVVSLQLPLNLHTRGLIGRREFALMKDSAVLVNTSRGGVVDEEALVEALRSGVIGGAALDVVAREPLARGEAILDAPHTVLTPHVAWYSLAAELRGRDHTLHAVTAFLRGEDLPYGSLA